MRSIVRAQIFSIGRTSLALAVCGLAAASPAKAATVVYVKADAAGANNGTSWIDAFTHLSPALTAAVAGDEIWVAAGIYRPAGPGGDRAATFQLKDGVGVFGGFAGNEASRDSRNSTANPTILSGDLNGDDGPGFSNNAENSYHVVTGSGTGATAVLDGFTIRGGNANGASSPGDRGGRLYNSGGSPTLTGCTFSGNATSSNGAAIYNTSGSPTLTMCMFIGNSAANGAALYNASGTPAMNRCTFGGNSASTNGGAIYNAFGHSPILASCILSGNTASSGGGLYSVGGNPALTNCLLYGNSANNGGGI